jgi:hypothetical protein
MSDAAKQGGVRAYARHRGVQHAAVQKRIARGHLVDSIARVNGRVVIDFRKADEEWARNTSRVRASPAAQVPLVDSGQLSVLVVGGLIALAYDADARDDSESWRLFDMTRATAIELGERLLAIANGKPGAR